MLEGHFKSQLNPIHKHHEDWLQVLDIGFLPFYLSVRHLLDELIFRHDDVEILADLLAYLIYEGKIEMNI